MFSILIEIKVVSLVRIIIDSPTYVCMFVYIYIYTCVCVCVCVCVRNVLIFGGTPECEPRRLQS
jgi:hypothetical protein